MNHLHYVAETRRDFAKKLSVSKMTKHSYFSIFHAGVLPAASEIGHAGEGVNVDDALSSDGADVRELTLSSRSEKPLNGPPVLSTVTPRPRYAQPAQNAGKDAPEFPGTSRGLFAHQRGAHGRGGLVWWPREGPAPVRR